MKKILKNILIISFNIIIIIYLTELLALLFFPSKTDSYIDIDYLRNKIAKERGISFDKRTYYKAFFEEKKNEPTLAPRYQFTSAYWSSLLYGDNNPFEIFLKNKIDKKNIIPFRGPINKKTLSCREGGKRTIANNDKYGFKNKNSIYDKKIRIIISGDSFAHGECENENTDIAGFLRNNYRINTANFGISGSGPLLSLATLTEYSSYIKPNYFIYLYYEGNDMHDLKNESKTFLIKYLDNYSQNLIEKREQIDKFFEEYEVVAYKLLKEKLATPSKFSKNFNANIKTSKDNNFVEKIKDFLELQKLKSILLSQSFFKNNNNSIDKELFTRVLKKMKTSSNEHGTELIFVYLPTWERFNSKFSFIKFSHKRKIENIVKNLNINYIDIAKIFSMSENPIELYPFGLSGHFTPEGYELIAREIYKIVEK